MPAICRFTMLSREIGRQASELRRFSREVGPSPVVLETREGLLRVPLIDLSPGGAKVRLTESLKEGARGRLYFLPPHWRPRVVEGIVWRVDLDGVAFLFTGPKVMASRGISRCVRPPDSWLWTWKADPGPIGSRRREALHACRYRAMSPRKMRLTSADCSSSADEPVRIVRPDSRM